MNEQVAYGMLTFCKNCGEQNPYQYKEITDEEIWEVWKEAKNITLHTEGAIIEVIFAKAILRKAQEK